MLEPIQNGGLTAPARGAAGLAAARRPRAARPRPRRQTARGQKIMRAIEQRQTAVPPPAAGIAPQRAAGGPPQRRVQAQASVAGGEQADLGQQLSRRVAAGSIDQGQAEKVAQDRAILEAAYGPDWRVKVFGDKGYVQRTRQALAQNPDDPQTKALYDRLLKQRSSALTRAKAKRGGKPIIDPAIVY